MGTLRGEQLAAFKSEIRAAHRNGRELQKRFGSRAEHGKLKRAEAELRDLGITPEKVRKLRQFARAYSNADLAELFDMCRRHGRKVHLTFLFRLSSIPKEGNARGALQKSMLKEAWSRAELDRRIRGYKPRRVAGRRYRLPATKNAAREMAVQRCDAWKQWARQLQETQLLPTRQLELLIAATAGVSKFRSSLVKALKSAAAGGG